MKGAAKKVGSASSLWFSLYCRSPDDPVRSIRPYPREGPEVFVSEAPEDVAPKGPFNYRRLSIGQPLRVLVLYVL
jgi:hypothetical protein